MSRTKASFVGCCVQDPHVTYQCYEEVLMGGNPTECNFWRDRFFVGQVEASSVGGWCSVSKVGRPGYWILLLLIRWIYDAIDLSYWPYMDMVS